MSARRGLFAIVPVKDPACGKARLTPLLNARERRALCLFLAGRTIQACAEAFGANRTFVVTSAPEVARMAAACGQQSVPEGEDGGGLNAAIALGAEQARIAGADALLVVPADLALVNAHELKAAAQAIPPDPGCLIVPDRRRSGTNLLGLSRARTDLFAFGELSLARHCELAERAGCEVCVHRSDALALDLDLPEDYAEWRAVHGHAARYPGQAGSIRA